MTGNRLLTAAVIVGALAVGACGGDTGEQAATTTPATTAPATTLAAAMAAGENLGAACRYTNPFSRGDECRRYTGDGWTDAARAEDCAAPFSNTEGELVGDGCEPAGSIGTCRVAAGEDDETLTFYYGGDAAMLSQFCANPGGGVWADAGDRSAAPGSAGDDVQAAAVEAMRSSAAVLVEPECADASCVASVEADRGALTFSPRASAPLAGLILLPGASVDARAYAPLAHTIAEAGFFVAIVPVPGGVSLGNEDRVEDVMSRNPEVETWFVGGHSLGGVAAASYAARAGSTVSGLVMWASFTSEQADLGDAAIPVVSIYASEDGLTTVAEVEAQRGFLPQDTRYVEIRGGNHAQFGFYGDQDGDGTALLPPEVQAQMVAEATAHFMASVSAGGLREPDPRYAQAAALEADWCIASQREITNLAGAALPVIVDEMPDHEAFVVSKPSVDASGVARVPMHRFEQGQHATLDAPPILTVELWCKHKSQDYFIEQGATASGEPGSCSAANVRAWEWALAALTSDERSRLETSGLEVVFAPDVNHGVGPAWLAGGVAVEIDAGVVMITSSSLIVPVDAGLEDESSVGLTYCKIWTPAEALRLALDP